MTPCTGQLGETGAGGKAGKRRRVGMPIGGSLHSRAGDPLQRAPCLDDTVRHRTIGHCTPRDEILPRRLSFGAAHLPRTGP
jgi:hypothetical protein